VIRCRIGLPALLVFLSIAQPTEAQEIRGRIFDAANGAPIGMAGVFLLDGEHNPVSRGSSDIAGFFVIKAPDVGEYYLYVQRIGYFENESPLISIAAKAEYALDIEMRPEPFRLDPIDVTVRNEELEQFLSLKWGVNPNSIFGYRAIQGIRLQEAKLKAVDTTDLLRWLYIPVSHGSSVCVGRLDGASRREIPWGTVDAVRVAAAAAERTCGGLFLDDYRYQNEHIESIDLDRIGVVVVTDGAVYLYTRDFKWNMRPGG